jgi:two-component system, response regulator
MHKGDFGTFPAKRRKMKREQEAQIVLIEDNPNDAEMMMESLSEESIVDRVHILKNGAEAVEYFFGTQERNGNGTSRQPRVIILDLKLPKVSGLEVLKRLKTDKKTRDIPVVIFTSSDEKNDREESYRIGANSYTVKPLDSDEFARVVSEICRYWLFMNKPAHDAS